MAVVGSLHTNCDTIPFHCALDFSENVDKDVLVMKLFSVLELWQLIIGLSYI